MIDNAKKQDNGLFSDKLIEYLMMVKLNGGDPVEVLEGWIREHVPYNLEDD